MLVIVKFGRLHLRGKAGETAGETSIRYQDSIVREVSRMGGRERIILLRIDQKFP